MVNLKRVLFCLITIFVSIDSYSQTTNWENFDKVLKVYIKNPTHENSNKAYNLLPEKVDGNDFPKSETYESIWASSVDLDSLMLKGNRDALRLQFKLYTIANAEYSIGQDISIGKMIVKYPKIFLQESRIHKRYRDIEYIVGKASPDFTDNYKLQLKEMEERKRALNTVSDYELIEMKKLCIQIIEVSENEIKKMMKNNK